MNLTTPVSLCLLLAAATFAAPASAQRISTCAATCSVASSCAAACTVLGDQQSVVDGRTTTVTSTTNRVITCGAYGRCNVFAAIRPPPPPPAPGPSCTVLPTTGIGGRGEMHQLRSHASQFGAWPFVAGYSAGTELSAHVAGGNRSKYSVLYDNTTLSAWTQIFGSTHEIASARDEAVVLVQQSSSFTNTLRFAGAVVYSYSHAFSAYSHPPPAAQTLFADQYTFYPGGIPVTVTASSSVHASSDLDGNTASFALGYTRNAHPRIWADVYATGALGGGFVVVSAQVGVEGAVTLLDIRVDSDASAQVNVAGTLTYNNPANLQVSTLSGWMGAFAKVALTQVCTPNVCVPYIGCSGSICTPSFGLEHHEKFFEFPAAATWNLGQLAFSGCAQGPAN